MKSLRYVEVYLQRYQPLAEAKGNLSVFIEDVYNAKQLHFRLGYQLPAACAEYDAVEMRR